MSKPAEALGATSTTTGAVSAEAMVQLGEIDGEADVEVRRYKYDDEADAVELSISSAVSMTIALDPPTAVELAEALTAAVEER